MIEKVYQNADDDRVAIRVIYTNGTDEYAYSDKECKNKVNSEELYAAFIKGLLIVDTSSNADGEFELGPVAGYHSGHPVYVPVYCSCNINRMTVAYVKNDTTVTWVELKSGDYVEM